MLCDPVKPQKRSQRSPLLETITSWPFIVLSVVSHPMTDATNRDQCDLFHDMHIHHRAIEIESDVIFQFMPPHISPIVWSSPVPSDWEYHWFLLTSDSDNLIMPTPLSPPKFWLQAGGSRSFEYQIVRAHNHVSLSRRP
jgi:hypothetical protein